MSTCYCEKCGRLKKEEDFYTSNNLEKYPPNGKLHQCKSCMTLMVDSWDPESFKWILEEVDVPYIPSEWNSCLARFGGDPSKVKGTTILGRYLSKMKLKKWNKYRWADSDRIIAEETAAKRSTMEEAGFTEEEIQEQLDRIAENAVLTPPAPSRVDTNEDDIDAFSEDPDIAENSLTEDDKIYLKLKWGRGYRWDEMVKMEQLYEDMMSSYDIQSASHKDYLILICKTSLKANQLIDAGDLDGYQKAAKMYDLLMKSSKFTAAQSKTDSGNVVDTLGELVAMAEKEGFIPRYYVATPQDYVDRTLQDLQDYTRSLIMEETNLGEMIDDSMKKILVDHDREQETAIDAESSSGDELEQQIFANEIDLLKDTELMDIAPREHVSIEKGVIQDGSSKSLRFVRKQKEDRNI